MPKLILKFKDTIVGEYHVSQGKPVAIGRKSTNDVVIENLAVSGRHATIEPTGGGYLLTDLKSKNGTFVNEQLVTTHSLKYGDVITIGKHTLTFTSEGGDPQPDPIEGMFDKTMVMDTAKHRDMLAKSNVRKTPSEAPAEERTGVLSFLTGGPGRMELTKKLTKIGRDPDSDIVAHGFFLGKTSAVISKRPNGYHLSYVYGMSKPKVNRRPVRDTVLLRELDVIEIGSTRMQFSLKD